MIISASRRTDIPAFYSDWFFNRLKAGYVITRNPMNFSQVRRVELTPDLVDCIVFWTKNPANILPKLKSIDEMGYKYYFQFTLTPYDNTIEKNLCNKKDIINTFIDLSKLIGREKVIWRYDPIILNDNLSVNFHFKMFDIMCKRLHKYTNICIISFVDIYTKLNEPLKKGIIREIADAEKLIIAEGFSKIAKEHNIQLKTCSEEISFLQLDIKPSICIDKNLIEQIIGKEINYKKDKNQRKACGCIQSIDIGKYNTCLNGCIYCYANYSENSIITNNKKYDVNSEILADNINI